MPEPRDPSDLPPEPWSKETAEDVEPNWAQSIRDGRKALGQTILGTEGLILRTERPAPLGLAS